MMTDIVLSVVIPMYNEEAVLPLLVARLRPVVDGLGVPYEVIAVDDGSRDGTFALLHVLRRTWPQLRIMRLRRNGGHQAALSAGLFSSVGAYVASLDADLQDPPEKIADMLALARQEKLDIVYGVRSDRSSDSRFKRWTAGGYYRLMRRLIGRGVRPGAGDFRLLSRETIKVLAGLPSTGGQVLRLLVPWLGFPSGEIGYVREQRAAGRTKYPLSKMLLLTLDSITSFSAAPLRIATLFGLVGVLLCGVLMLVALVAYLMNSTVSGWASLYVAVLFLGAVQLLCLGLLGEYVGRIYTAVQGRPTYFVGYDSAKDSMSVNHGSGLVNDHESALVSHGERLPQL